MMSRKIAE